MKEIDRKYQEVIDGLANEFVMLSSDKLLALPDFDSITRTVNDTSIEIAFWHYILPNDEHHFVFIADRTIFWTRYNRYISGVVFGPDTEPRLMTDKETLLYD